MPCACSVLPVLLADCFAGLCARRAARLPPPAARARPPRRPPPVLPPMERYRKDLTALRTSRYALCATRLRYSLRRYARALLAQEVS